MKKDLKSLSKKEFEQLKKSGMLWEIYPDAPEFYEEISVNQYPTNELRPKSYLQR